MIWIEPLKLHPRFCHVLPYERKWLCIQYHCKRSAKGRMNQKSSALCWERIEPLQCAVCRTEHLKTITVILNLIVCFETMWSFLVLVWNKLVRVTRKVRPPFSVLYFLDPQLLTVRTSGLKITAAKFWCCLIWLRSSFLSASLWLPWQSRAPWMKRLVLKLSLPGVVMAFVREPNILGCSVSLHQQFWVFPVLSQIGVVSSALC